MNTGNLVDGGCGPIVVIDRCEPARSYLVRCLEEATDGAKVVAFASALQWLQVAKGYPQPKAVLIVTQTATTWRVRSQRTCRCWQILQTFRYSQFRLPGARAQPLRTAQPWRRQGKEI